MRRTLLNWWIPVGVLAISTWSAIGTAQAQSITPADFEDLSLGSEGYWNGSDGSGGFTSGELHFNNAYDLTWGSWYDWSYSNTTDTTTPGYGNQYSAFAGGGQGGSENYGVGCMAIPWSGNPFPVPPTITLPTPGWAYGAYFTNTTYAALSMRDGSVFPASKKFGGASGVDPDWFLLTITGKDASGTITNTVEHYLADYRYDNNELDYIADQWEWINLLSLGKIKTIEFELASSDTDPIWGMNTPAYFAIDTLSVVPEPSTIMSIASGALVALLWWWRRRR